MTGPSPRAAGRLDFRSVLERRRTPLSTYRLQLNPEFGFTQAAALAAYLDDLGITDCYTSPILKTRPGSAHGYDVADCGAINPELGGEAGFRDFAAALRARGMGYLLDVVPNHMSTDPRANLWWRDVLENGPASEFADFFDIDWEPETPELQGKVLLPILEDQYGAVLERGELRLRCARGAFCLAYRGDELPLDPREAPRILRHRLDELSRELLDDPALRELRGILLQLECLPPRSAGGRARGARRETEAARARLERLLARSSAVARHVEAALAFFNGRPGDARSFDALHGLLEAQAYRLANWKTAADQINYRRFFDVNELVGLRVELPEVFRATHALVLELLASGDVTGLRVDHVDGLYDPAGYLDALQDAFLRAWMRRRTRPEGELTPEELGEIGAWRAARLREDFSGPAARPLYVAAEKILSTGESLDPLWAVDGTTGYDFLNDVNRVLVDPAGAAALRAAYERFVGRPASPADVVYASKKLIVSTVMSGELNVMAQRLRRLAERDRRTRDFTPQSLRRALREVVACFPVYRTYLTRARLSEADRAAVDRAAAQARRRLPALDPTVFDFVRAQLLPEPGAVDAAYPERLGFAMRFQQYTAPVQAKGLEDTALYRFHVLLAANEVGADPSRPSGSAREFHQANAARAAGRPRSMLATATHDTKRGEDARARLDVLSELPDAWGRAVRRWARANAGGPAPAPDDEYLFYQALLGAWDCAQEEPPASLRERLRSYLVKAAREAKERTNWLSPDETYEERLRGFVDAALGNPAFLSPFRRFVRRAAACGAVLSLSRTLLKVASPGVCDFFQGSELWDLSFVDPDNRRPVDFALRRERLAALAPLLAAPSPSGVRELLLRWEDGRIKLYVVAQLLRLRRALPELFLSGGYEPVPVAGPSPERFLAFRRRFRGRDAIAVAPRLVGKALWKGGLEAAGGLARGCRLDSGDAGFDGLRDVLTGALLPPDGSLETALSALPLALFVRD